MVPKRHNATYKGHTGRTTPYKRGVARVGLDVRNVWIYLFIATAPAALRASSMKVCATGLSVRFFNVTMASGLRVDGSSIGSAFIVRPGTGNCSATRGIIDR